LLASCNTTPSTDTSSPEAGKAPVVTPEMKELSDKMIQASRDLSVSQVIGNTAFKSYDKLTAKYGEDPNKLSQTKEFSGKDGFVVLDGLKPETQYSYEILSGTNKISMGTVKTQKK